MKNTKKADLKIENSEKKKVENSEEKKEKNEKLIKELTKERDKFQDELDSKEYLIDGGESMAKELLKFVRQDAKWKFTEALGIIEIVKTLEKITSGNKKEFMIGPLELEAIYYFLSKHEGTGYQSAKRCVDFLKAINPAKSRKDSDGKKFEELNFKITSLEHGVDPEEAEKEMQNNEKK